MGQPAVLVGCRFHAKNTAIAEETKYVACGHRPSEGLLVRMCLSGALPLSPHPPTHACRGDVCPAGGDCELTTGGWRQHRGDMFLANRSDCRRRSALRPKPELSSVLLRGRRVYVVVVCLPEVGKEGVRDSVIST